MDALLRRLTKFRYLTDKLTVADLMIRADTDLFKNMQMPQHCLHHLLSPLRTTDRLALDNVVIFLVYLNVIQIFKESPSLCVLCMISFSLFDGL